MSNNKLALLAYAVKDRDSSSSVEQPLAHFFTYGEEIRDVFVPYFKAASRTTNAAFGSPVGLSKLKTRAPRFVRLFPI